MPTYWQKKERVGGGTERETEIKRRDFIIFYVRFFSLFTSSSASIMCVIRVWTRS